MKTIPLILALLLLTLPVFASEESLVEPESALDKPLGIDHVDVKPSAEYPLDAESPPGHGDVACTTYDHVMVKQIDIGDKGAAQLAWTLIKGKDKPACTQDSGKDQYTIPADAWNGYYESAAWPYLFFGADDGSNGGMGFAVFSATDHKKILDDIAVGNVTLGPHNLTGATLKYTRAWRAPCSVVSQGDACWGGIAQTLDLPASPAPDCAEGYLKQKTDMAQMRCQNMGRDDESCTAEQMKALDAQKWDAAPSVIAYTVEATIKGSDVTLKPAGGTVSCYASE